MDDYRDFPSEFELGASETPPPSDAASVVGTDERRMHVRAYNYWVSLLDGRDFPSVADLDPDSVADFGPHSVLVDLRGSLNNPATPFVGSAIKDEIGIQEIRSISDIPGRSLLSRLTDHHFQIVATRAPVGFEAEFVNQRGHDIRYRGILMPFSSDGDVIDYVYGVINWKDNGQANLADAKLTPALPRLVAERDDEQEVLDKLYAEEDDLRQRYERRQQAKPVVEDTDEAWALEALEAMGLSLDDEPAEPTGHDADPSDAAPAAPAEPASLYGSLLGIRRAPVAEPAAIDIGSTDEDDGVDALPATFELDAFDDAVIEVDHEENAEVEFGSLVEAIGAPKKVPSTDAVEPRAPPRFAQPAPRAYDFDPTLYADAAPVPNTNIDIAEPVMAADAGLADRLELARETAEAVKAGEGRTRAALYDALAHAYDFALAAREDPAEYEELLADSGVKAQSRAPMTPIVKLVFGIDYDKGRLTEFAAALSFADRSAVAKGGFKDFIAKQPGGLKALVAFERQARRPDQPLDDRLEQARETLRRAPALTGAEFAQAGEFSLVVMRRGADGTLEPVALITDEALVDRAIRKAG